MQNKRQGKAPCRYFQGKEDNKCLTTGLYKTLKTH